MEGLHSGQRQQARGQAEARRARCGRGEMGAEFSACPHTMIRLAMARRAAVKWWVMASCGGRRGLDDSLGAIGMGTDERAPPGLKVLLIIKNSSNL
jgi:hypothetical protein